MLATEQIARALIPAKVTVFVPHYAMSGGTMLALAADEIVMDVNAVLGPVDPQIGGYAAASILQVVAEKPIAEIDDQTLILANLARKARQQVQNFVRELLKDEVPKRKIAPERIESLIQALTSGRVTHDYPITAEEARELGLPISTELPPQIYALMDLYPQANIGRPSVPLPAADPARVSSWHRRPWLLDATLPPVETALARCAGGDRRSLGGSSSVPPGHLPSG